MDFYEIVVSDFEILEKENLLSGTDLKVIAKQRAHFEEKLQCANAVSYTHLRAHET